MAYSSSKQNNDSIPWKEIYGGILPISNIFYWFIALILLALFAGIFIVMANNDVFYAIVMAASIPPMLGALYLVYREKFEIAATFVSAILITTITITATHGLGIHHIGILGFPIILIVASLVTRKQTIVMIALYNILCVAWLAFGGLFG